MRPFVIDYLLAPPPTRLWPRNNSKLEQTGKGMACITAHTELFGQKSEIENLINQVKGKVLDKTGISLQLEIQIIGEKS